MPYLHIRTTEEIDDPDIVLREASRLCADMLGKSERYVMVCLEADMPMSFAGSREACAYLELKSLGLPREHAAEYSAQLCDFVERFLGVPPSRTYIEFSCGDRALWGFNRGTFG